MSTPKPTCFVIAPIGSPNSDIRLRSDRIVKEVVVPATKAYGYEALRADQLPSPGLVTSKMIQHIAKDALVIADLTGHNPNVFYELGLHHAVRKPVIQIIRSGETIPFDTAAVGTINVDERSEDGLECAKNELVDAIKTIQQNKSRIDTPMSAALPEWIFGTPDQYVPRQVIESLVRHFIELTSALNHKGHLDTCGICKCSVPCDCFSALLRVGNPHST